MSIDITQLKASRPASISASDWNDFIDQRQAAALERGHAIVNEQEAQNQGFRNVITTTEEPSLGELLLLQEKTIRGQAPAPGASK